MEIVGAAGYAIIAFAGVIATLVTVYSVEQALRHSAHRSTDQ